MKIKNTKNKANYLNFRVNGVPKKIMIPAGKVVQIPTLTKLSQILNEGDLNRGGFEAIAEAPTPEVKEAKKEKKATKAKKTSKKASKKTSKKSEDTLAEIEKAVKEYTDNEKEL